jgi:hypothetical protein
VATLGGVAASIFSWLYAASAFLFCSPQCLRSGPCWDSLLDDDHAGTYLVVCRAAAMLVDLVTKLQ